MNDVRDRNKQIMMMENGYGVYRGGGHHSYLNGATQRETVGGGGGGMVRPEMHARTETEGSSDVLG